MRERWVWVRKSLKARLMSVGERRFLLSLFSLLMLMKQTKLKSPKSPYISLCLVDNGVMKMESFGGLQKGICGTKTIINWSVCEICLCVYVCYVWQCEVGLVKEVEAMISWFSCYFSRLFLIHKFWPKWAIDVCGHLFMCFLMMGM